MDKKHFVLKYQDKKEEKNKFSMLKLDIYCRNRKEILIEI